MHPETKANGDDDPLDVCEIGEAIGTVGQVKQVKVLVRLSPGPNPSLARELPIERC